MCFKRQFGSLLIYVTYLIFIYPTLALAQDSIDNQILHSPQLLAKPKNCVTLNEGRTCFAKVTLMWRVANADKVCVVEKKQQHVLHCFNHLQDVVGEFHFEFESNSTQRYQLVDSQKNVLAETSVEVNWVYEATPRKRRWRVF